MDVFLGIRKWKGGKEKMKLTLEANDGFRKIIKNDIEIISIKFFKDKGLKVKDLVFTKKKLKNGDYAATLFSLYILQEPKDVLCVYTAKEMKKVIEESVKKQGKKTIKPVKKKKKIKRGKK